MGKSTTLSVVASALAVCLTPAVSSADVVFNTFTLPLPPPLPSSLGRVVREDSMHLSRVANQFTVTGSDYWLDGVALVLLQHMAPVSPLGASLWEDYGGYVGRHIAGVEINIDSAYPQRQQHLVETLTGTNIRLSKNTSYWICVDAPPRSGVTVFWRFGNTSAPGRVLLWDNFEETYLDEETLCAFTIYGTPVKPDVAPEPSSLLALLAGTGAMGCIMLRRKR